MPGRKITENPQLVTWTATDAVAIVDRELDITKYIEVQHLLNNIPWVNLSGTPSSVISVSDGIAWTGVNLNTLICTDKLDDVLRRGNVSAARGATFGSHVTIANNGNLIVPSGSGKILFGTSVHSGGSAIFEIAGDQSFAQGFGVSYRNNTNTAKYKLFYDNNRNELALRSEHLADTVGASFSINTQYSTNNELLSANKNTVLRVSRGNPSDYEALELRNEGLPSSSGFKHAIRVSKTGIGVLRDFTLEYFDGSVNEVFRVTGSTKQTEWKHKVLFSEKIQYTDGSEGTNKVLISDVNGNATWSDIGSVLPPSGTDQYVTNMNFNGSNNLLTLNRSAGLPDLVVNLSSLAGGESVIPTLQQVVTQGRTSSISIYNSAAFYGGTVNTGIVLGVGYKFISYGGSGFALSKYFNSATGFTDNDGLDVGITDVGEGLISLRENSVLRFYVNSVNNLNVGVSSGNLIQLPQSAALSSVTFNKIAILDSSGIVGAKTIAELGLATQSWVNSVLPTDFVSKTNGGTFDNTIFVRGNLTINRTVGSLPAVVLEHVGGTTGRIRIQDDVTNTVLLLNGAINQYISGSLTLGSNTILNDTDIYIDRPLTVGNHESEFIGKIKMFDTNSSGTATKGIGIASDNTLTEFDFSEVTSANNYVTSGSFGTGTGIVTLNRQGLSAVTFSLDGRYLTSYTVTQGDIATHMGAFDGKNLTWTGSTLQVNIRTTTPVSVLALDSNGDITSALTLGTGLSIVGGALTVTSVSGTPNKLVGESSAGVLVDTSLGTGFSFAGSTLNYKVSGTTGRIPKFDAAATYGINDSLIRQFTSGLDNVAIDSSLIHFNHATLQPELQWWTDYPNTFLGSIKLSGTGGNYTMDLSATSGIRTRKIDLSSGFDSPWMLGNATTSSTGTFNRKLRVRVNGVLYDILAIAV